jgi:hypothetical protein
MTTITINEKSKAGKIVLDLARLLAKENSGVIINKNEQIVAKNIKGYPVNKKEYIALVKEADARISSGIFTTSDDLDAEIKSW